MPNPILKNSYKIPESIKTQTLPTMNYSQSLDFGDRGYFNVPSNFKYVGRNNKVHTWSEGRAAIGTGQSSWLDNWNKARLKTGRFNDQLGLDPNLGKTNLELQKQNRDTTQFIFNPDVKVQKVDNRTAFGYYDPNKHTGWLGSTATSTQPTLFIHETSHASRAVPQYQKISNIIDSKTYSDPYLDDPNEVYSRLNELRYTYKLDPTKEYDDKEIERLKRKSKNGFDILNRYDTSTLKQLINDVAQVSQSTNPLLAKCGIKLPILFKKNGNKY